MNAFIQFLKTVVRKSIYLRTSSIAELCDPYGTGSKHECKRDTGKVEIPELHPDCTQEVRFPPVPVPSMVIVGCHQCYQ